MSMRDGYSNFAFYTALSPDIYGGGAGVDIDTNGNTIDMQGFDTATIIVMMNSFASAGATSIIHLILEHGLASAAGVSAWSLVPGSLMLHSVYGVGGAYSTGASGLFQSFATSASVLSNAVYAIGYKGDHTHRYLRLALRSIAVEPSSANIAAIAILGEPANWPINDAV